MKVEIGLGDIVTPRFANMAKGTRLTEERLAVMVAKVETTLTEQEVDIFIKILLNKEAALA